jgi:hypothetical protein
MLIFLQPYHLLWRELVPMKSTGKCAFQVYISFNFFPIYLHRKLVSTTSLLRNDAYWRELQAMQRDAFYDSVQFLQFLKEKTFVFRMLSSTIKSPPRDLLKSRPLRTEEGQGMNLYSMMRLS